MGKALALSLLGVLLTLVTWAEPFREEFDLGDYEPEIVQWFLKTVDPEVKFEIEGHTLVLLSDSRAVVEQVLELLHELDRPLERVSLRVQLVGLSQDEQEKLGIHWREVSLGTSFGPWHMTHLLGRSPNQLSSIPDGPFITKTKVASSGDPASFTWSEKLTRHAVQSGRLSKTESLVGLDLDVTTVVKSDNQIICKLFLVTHLPGKELKEASDVRLSSGESVAIGGLFPREYRIPALGYLPSLGPLLTAPAEPVLLITPTVMEQL